MADVLLDIVYRAFEVVAIFLGVFLRTGAPFFRKKKLNELLTMEMSFIYTAITAFGATWLGIIVTIPIGIDPVFRIFAAFFIAFAGDGILNEALKYKEQYKYIKTGELPPQ